MGIAQIALDPPPSLKRANVEKKCSKPSWQSVFTLPPLLGNAHIWEEHISKRNFPYSWDNICSDDFLFFLILNTS